MFSLRRFLDLGITAIRLVSPRTSVRPGDRSEMFVAGAGAMAHALSGYAARLFAKAFLDGCSGDDLHKLGKDRYSLDFIPAVKAEGEVTITRASTLIAVPVPLGTVLATTRDANNVEVQFQTTAALSYLVGEGSKTVGIRAVSPGRAGNVDPALVNRIITGLGDTFTVTNAAAITGGDEDESDDHYRQRCRESRTTLRRGVLAALEFGAKSVTTVKNAFARDHGYGEVALYVSDAEGNSNPTMVAAVVAEMPNWKAAGATLTTVGGTPYPTIPVTITLYGRKGLNSSAIKTAAAKSIALRSNNLIDGEDLRRELISAAALAVDMRLTGCDVTIPATDVNVPDGQKATVLETNVTVNVVTA
jgi:hypothetical protein